MTLHDHAACVSALGALIQHVAAGSLEMQMEATARRFRFLIGAYTMIWVILAVYIMSLSTRLHRVSKQLRRLKERLDS